MNYFKILFTIIFVMTTISLFSQINKDAILKDSYFQEHKINLKNYMWDDAKLNNKINYLYNYRENPYFYFLIGTTLEMIGSSLLIDSNQNDRYILSFIEIASGAILIITSVPLQVLCVTSSIKQYKFKKALQEKFQY